MESKLVRILRYAGRDLTLNEAYKLQSVVFPVVRNEQGFIIDPPESKDFDHLIPTYSYGMFTGNGAKQLKNKHPKVARYRNCMVNGKPGPWIYTLIVD